jgi:hypothetical protein
MGVSLKRGKIWETAAAESLLDFRDWCHELSAALAEDEVVHATVPHLQLRLPSELDRFPQRPVAAILDYRLVRGGVQIVVDAGRIDLVALEAIPKRVNDHELELELALDDTTLWRGRLRASGSVEPLTAEREIRWEATREHLPLTEALTEFPPVIFFADGSSSERVTLYVPPEQLAPIPPETFSAWDWSGVDIRNEQNATAQGAPINIQARARIWAEETLADPILITDHAAYEIADLIAIERRGDSVHAHLIHCKRSGEPQPGARLSDLYDVLAQGVRSARWTHPVAFFRELDRRLRERPNIEILRDPGGDARELAARWADEGADLALTVWVVQPGLSSAASEQWAEGLTLISAAREWCQDQNATLRLAISP